MAKRALPFLRLLVGCCAVILLLGPTASLAKDPTVSITATIPSPNGAARFIGYTAPGSLVSFKDTSGLIGTTAADSNGLFDKTFTEIKPSKVSYSISATDKEGRQSLTIGFDLVIIGGSTTTVSGFIIPVTYSIQDATIKRPENQKIYGRAKPNSPVTLFFSGSKGDKFSAQVTSNDQGSWDFVMNDPLHLGQYSVRALTQDSSGIQSELSASQDFTVTMSADLNRDSKINLTDFSILMFNYGRLTVPNKLADINDSGPVDLVDFSIMMFNWTGA